MTRVKLPMKRLLSSDVTAFLAMAVLSVLLSLAACQFVPTLVIAENGLMDLRVSLLSKQSGLDSIVVLVTVTDETLASLPYRSPTDRALLADTPRQIDDAKPRAIGFDFFFDQPTEPSKDEYLFRTLGNLSSPLVVAGIDRFEMISEDRRAFHPGRWPGGRC